MGCTSKPLVEYALRHVPVISTSKVSSVFEHRFSVFLWDLESLRRLRLSVEFYSVTISGQAKYDAWSSLGDLSQSDAMLMYIDLYNR